jgi:hypothetical protein
VSGEERQHKNAEQGGRDVPKALQFSNKWDEMVAAGGKSTIDPRQRLWRRRAAHPKEVPVRAEFGLSGEYQGTAYRDAKVLWMDASPL